MLSRFLTDIENDFLNRVINYLKRYGTFLALKHASQYSLSIITLLHQRIAANKDAKMKIFYSYMDKSITHENYEINFLSKLKKHIIFIPNVTNNLIKNINSEKGIFREGWVCYAKWRVKAEKDKLKKIVSSKLC